MTSCDVKISRRDVTAALEEKRIGTRLLFAGNLTKQPGFKILITEFQGIEQYGLHMERAFWIGVWPGLTDEHLDYMVSALNDIMSKV